MPLGIKGFQKGRKKTGGRKKGTLNRPKPSKTIVLKEILDPKIESQRLLKNVEPAATAAPIAGPTSSILSRAAIPGHGRLVESWREKRKQAMLNKETLSASQLVNMMYGLTPDGYDKNGVKVSFVERDKPFGGSFRRRLSED
jgi:hypothetical protein